jgi:hypothetical protein
MVIGYSFSDEHINDAILNAVRTSGLELFLIDPAGEAILDKRDPRALIPDHPGVLMEVIQPRIIGLSRRPLSSTFDKDTVEHAKVMRFFRT